MLVHRFILKVLPIRKLLDKIADSRFASLRTGPEAQGRPSMRGLRVVPVPSDWRQPALCQLSSSQQSGRCPLLQSQPAFNYNSEPRCCHADLADFLIYCDNICNGWLRFPPEKPTIDNVCSDILEASYGSEEIQDEECEHGCERRS